MTRLIKLYIHRIAICNTLLFHLCINISTNSTFSPLSTELLSSSVSFSVSLAAAR